MSEPGRTLYYPVWVSNSGRVSLRWGQPCDDALSACRIGEAQLKSGRATLSFVVEFSDGEKTPLLGWTRPESAKKILKHWESLWDATEGGRP